MGAGQIARENIAIALADMVEDGLHDLDDAKAIAHAWLFDNPNRFYRLGSGRERSPMIVSASGAPISQRSTPSGS